MAEYTRLVNVEKDNSSEFDEAATSDEFLVSYVMSCKTHYAIKKSWFWVLAAVWSLSIACTAIITAMFAYQLSTKQTFGTFARGYSTDFGPARQALELQPKTFTGSPRFDEHGNEYIPPHSPSLKYIGSGADVDAAWEELEKDRYFLLTDEEARAAWGSNFTQFWDEEAGGYLGGLDMFHTLHCLDHLRKSFYPDVYHLDGIHGQMHQLHCIDHLRQMIQCNSDLTVIPTRKYIGIGQNYIDSSMTHTCRNFDRVRQWATSRYSGELAVQPRSLDSVT